MLAANSLASAILTSVQVCGTGLNRDFVEKSSEVKICLILDLIALQMCLIMFTSATSRHDLLCLLYCFVLCFFLTVAQSWLHVHSLPVKPFQGHLMLFQFSKTNFSFILISGGLKSHVYIVLLAASDQAAFEQ